LHGLTRLGDFLFTLCIIHVITLTLVVTQGDSFTGFKKLLLTARVITVLVPF